MSISLFNQQEKFNTEQHKNPATPAERAEAVWDRRIGSAVVQAYNWRRISLGLIVVCIVLAAGLVWQSMKTTVIPYVVTVNETTGEIKKAGAFVEADYTPQEAEIKYFIAEFVKNAVGVDNVCERSAAACGGKIIIPKVKGNGVTCAVGVIPISADFERRAL